MALTAWDRELGTTQGRIAPQTITPPEGDFVFVLGRDLPGLFQKLDIGDFAEVKQTADFGVGTNILRFRASLRPPKNIPAGTAWKASLLIDGAEISSRILEPDLSRSLTDWAANVSKLTGNHELIFKLELIAA